MIAVVTYKNLYKFGKEFYSQFRLRHQCFIKRLNYQVSTIDGMEYDQYDTPAAVYLVYLGSQGDVLGCSRLTPVQSGSMLHDLWPNLVEQPDHIFRPRVWEGTRFCIDKKVPPPLRLRICRELVIAYFEAGLLLNIDQIIGVMPPPIFKFVFGNQGCTFKMLGPRMKLPSGETIAAAAMDISAPALLNIRKRTQIYESVLIDDTEEFTTKQVA